MGARRNYVVNIALAGDTSGLKGVDSALKEIETRADALNTHDIDVNVTVSGNAVATLKDIEGHLGKIKSREISVNATGNFEESLKNVEGHLDKISKTVETKVNVGGNYKSDLKEIKSHLESISKNQTIKVSIDTSDVIKSINGVKDEIGTIAREFNSINARNLRDLGTVIASGFRGASSELGKIQTGINSLKPSDVGYKIANDLEGASSQVGKIQNELNSLKPPIIQPQIQPVEMNQYYGSYDSLGHLNMGALGGSSLLSMVGVGSFKNITWGNASKEQTNSVLLSRMDASDPEHQISAKTFEGGTDTITHAVSQKRTVRNPDLISQLYAFQMATGATNEELMTNVFGNEPDMEWGSGSLVDVLAAFGESVALQTGSEQLGTSAMFDLAKAFGGQYASVDQYGISEETLKRHGYDPKKEEDVVKFMEAVGEIIAADTPNALMDTTEGGLTQVRKRFQRAGRQIGQMFMGPIDFLSTMFLRLDTSNINIGGLEIPAGTFTQAVIGITGIVSAIDPFQRTLAAVKDTFHKVTGAVQTAKDNIVLFAEKLVSLGSIDKVDRFNKMGAFNILSQEKYAREHDMEIFRANLERIKNTKGIHDFSDEEINASNMTWGQKRRTRNAKAFDSILFDFEREKDWKNLRDHLYGPITEELRNDPTIDKNELSVERNKRLRAEWEKFVTGRENELSQLSNWQKFKLGAKRSYEPQTSAFKEAFKKQKDKYKEGGWFTQLRGKTIGNFRGIREGISAFREAGGLKGGLSGLWTVFKGLIGAINPVTLALGAITAGLGLLAGIFLVANAQSEDFRKKVQDLTTKLHDLLDTVFYTLGDLFQAAGLSKEGGMDGVIEVAENIVSVLETIVSYIQNVLLAMTGRDLVASKKLSPIDKEITKTIEKINKKEKESGVGSEDVQKDYQKLLELKDRAQTIDPTYVTDEKLAEWFDPETGAHNLEFGDGKTLKEYLTATADQRDPETARYNYFNEELIPSLEGEGISGITEDELNSAVWNQEANAWDHDKMEQLNSAIAQHRIYVDTAGREGTAWNENPFVKANPVLQVDEPEGEDAWEKRGGIGAQIFGQILDVVHVLEWIGNLVFAILALMAVEKALNGIESLLTRWRNVPGGSKWEKAKNVFKSKFPSISHYGSEAKNWIRDLWDRLRGNPTPNPKPSKNPELPSKTPELPEPEGPHNGPDKKPPKGYEDAIDVKPVEHGTHGSDKKPPSPNDYDDVIDVEPEHTGKPSNKPDVPPKNTPELPPPKETGNQKPKKGYEDAIDVDFSKKPRNTGLEKEAKNTGSFLERAGSKLKDTFHGITSKFSGAFGRIASFLGRNLGGRALLSAIPIVGQIIDALWIAWDLTSWIGDWLDTNIPWAGQLFEMISPLRMIQKHWTEIYDMITGFGGAIKDWLRSIGLGALADALQWIWDCLVGIYEFIQNIPIIGWLFPHIDRGDGGTGENATDSSKPQFTDVQNNGNTMADKYGSKSANLNNSGSSNDGDSAKTMAEKYGSRGANFDNVGDVNVNTASSSNVKDSTFDSTASATANAVDNGLNNGFNDAYSNALNPAMNNGSAYNNPLLNPNSTANANLMNNPYANNAMNNQTSNNTINNYVNLSGFENGDKLAQYILKVINENMLWDTQKAGRTVDNNGTKNPFL
ncbi:MAG: hypothetical protein BZ138_07255 [Methanosphaera sp. rholeuAM270]|nr:MAG: hypothetical protein BZ138_07255 [Methanosphaera sp. rholeuAM270]